MKKDEAKFRFLDFRIQESRISIKDANLISDQLNVNFEQSEYLSDEESLFKYEMSVGIEDDNKYLNIQIVASGLFEFDKNLTDLEKQAFFSVNAPAILFPYVRAYITTLTSLSGIKPVILPTLNMSTSKEN
jgi:preprotein translocase subunit SecB